MALKPPKIIKDNRGTLAAPLFDLGETGEVMYSSILPGCLRGNHYHKVKTEYLCVVAGRAKVRMRQVETDEKKEFEVTGDKLENIEVLPFWTHSLENIGEEEMRYIEYANRPFNPVTPDSFSEEV